MHLVIHIGPAKTATTAFQGWLRANRAGLGANGVFWSATGTVAAGNAVRLMPEMLDLDAPDRETRAVPLLRAWREELDAFDGDAAVLSCEQVSRFLTADARRPAPLRPERIPGRAAALRAFCDRIGAATRTVLLTLRNEADRAASQIVQSLHALAGHIPHRPLPPVELDGFVLPYDRMAAGLENEGFAVRLVPFADPRGDRPLPHRLMEAAGLGDRIPAGAGDADRLNVSFGLVGCHAAMVVKDAMDATFPPGQRRARLNRTWFAPALVDTYWEARPADPPFNGVGPALARTLSAEADAVYARLPGHLDADARARLGRSRWLDAPLSPVEPGALDPDARAQVADLLARLIERARAAPRADAGGPHHKTVAEIARRAEALA
jgi:hypothetical protein